MMKRVLIGIFFSLIFLGNYGCRMCNESLLVGEILIIPIQFNGFSVQELNNMQVIRKSNNNLEMPDSFLLSAIVFSNEIRTTTIEITDKDARNRFGYYESYFNDCNLIFYWENGSDSFTNFMVKKHQGKTKDRCHKNDPNVAISELSFLHQGQMIGKDETVQISK